MSPSAVKITKNFRLCKQIDRIFMISKCLGPIDNKIVGCFLKDKAYSDLAANMLVCSLRVYKQISNIFILFKYLAQFWNSP